MAIQIKDPLIGKDEIVKIGYYNVNRTGFFQDGQPKFSVNLYLDYYLGDEIIKKKDISIDELSMDELNFSSFYEKMKELEEFAGAKDILPVYIPLEEKVSEEEISEEIATERTGPEEVVI